MFLCSLVFALAPSTARVQIVKCTDTGGHVTYQQAPCVAGQQGRAIELVKDKAPPNASTWESAAAAGQVVSGMPKRWVLRARGTPVVIRAATAAEEATEIWRYPQAATVLTIGFAGDAVVWVRDEPRLATAPEAAPALAGAPAARPGTATAPPSVPDNRRSAEARSLIARGSACDLVLAEMGPPDRKEPVQISAAALGGPDILAAATKYIYDARADADGRTVFTCLGGKVADVEHGGARGGARGDAR